MNFILTGVTGVLGSHIFYELLQKIHDNNYNGEIVLLLRSKNDKTHTERFEEVFTEKLLPDYLKQIDVTRLRRDNVKLIDMDLKSINDADLKY